MLKFENFASSVHAPNSCQTIASCRVGQQPPVGADRGIHNPLLRSQRFGCRRVSSIQQLPSGRYIPNRGDIAARNSQAFAQVVELEIETGLSSTKPANKLAMHWIKKRDHSLR